MKPSRAILLLHPLFITSLAVLLLNDFYWKYSYHNWLTGKLSDVAGLVVLPIFLRELFPGMNKWKIMLATALFFTWWKLPLSQPLVDICNNTLALPVQRVIDYTDLLVLPVLVLSYYVKPRRTNFHSLLQRGFHYSLAFMAFFSLCATSMPYRRGLYLQSNENEVYFDESFKVNKSEQEVLLTLKQKNITYKRDSIEYAPVANQPWLYHRLFNEKDSTVTWQRVDMDTTLFIKTESVPYYFIRDYEAGNIKLWRIKFLLKPDKKNAKSSITILSFQTANSDDASSMSRNRRKAYKRVFEQLFQ
jgi:hypothetical protein